MNNPWLDIPVADYLGHMSSPAVNQGPVLNRLLREALETVRPPTVLVLGGSTGNGLEHVNPDVTSRVSVIDINPAYLHRLAERFPNPHFDLDTRCGDLADLALEREAFALVHAGLVFEYIDWPMRLPAVVAALRSGGMLSVVLQLPSASAPAVTPTPFTSLRGLESLFRFVDPEVFVAAACAAGLRLRHRRVEPVAGGKAFEVLRFERDAA
jgi:SAM-dependent methyltransferase